MHLILEVKFGYDFSGTCFTTVNPFIHNVPKWSDTL